MIWCFIVVLVKETDAAQDGLFAPEAGSGIAQSSFGKKTCDISRKG